MRVKKSIMVYHVYTWVKPVPCDFGGRHYVGMISMSVHNQAMQILQLIPFVMLESLVRVQCISVCCLQVAQAPGDHHAAANRFATAAALYAQGMSQTGLALSDSGLSSASSDASSLAEDAFSFFMPLREETNNLAGKTEKAPVPDQSWWEEFGEWESASNVSHLYTVQAVTNATQPRLLLDDHVVRLPVARPAAKLSYDSFPQLSKLIQRSPSEDEEYAYSPRALGPLPDWGVLSEVWVRGRLSMHMLHVVATMQ